MYDNANKVYVETLKKAQEKKKQKDSIREQRKNNLNS